ncbi:MAG: hypothetical protein LBR44_11945 [Clostridiales Family XIII bacterium]|jgi:hypothetical protein|nr:hypothetical protein [Clostridiales Family XIII bacterium]
MLTQAEADNLIAMLKTIERPTAFRFPLAGEQKTVDAVSGDGRERFLFDVNRSHIKLSKCTYQNRYRKDTVLLRLDIGRGPHNNPDGSSVDCPHLHIYKEGYEDRWAYALPAGFTADENLITKLIEFLKYCNVENIDALPMQGAI